MLQKIERYFLYFMIYSMIGWVSEVFILGVVYQKGFFNRGALFGPYCPVYGVCAVLLILSFHWLMKQPVPGWVRVIRPFLVFLGCMVLATLLELMASYLLEDLTGRWPWQTYSRFTFNFERRIALPPAVFFGLGGTAILYWMQPGLEKLTGGLPPKVLHACAGILFGVIAVDFIHFCISL